MSEKMTRIGLPSGKGSGFMDYGDVPAEDIIATYRRMAQRELEAAQEVLAAADSDFRIDVVRGVYVQHLIRAVQPGRAHLPDCRCVGCARARSA